MMARHWSRNAAATLALLLIATLPLHAGAVALVRGPYLQMMNQTSVVVAWRTDVAAPGRVRVGASATALSRTIDESTAKVQHAVRIDGLTPDTVYAYEIGTGTQVLSAAGPKLRFRTAPADQSRPVRGWFFGDSGSGAAGQVAVRDAYRAHVGSQPADFWLHLGDIAYNNGTATELTTKFFGIYTDELASVPVFPALGNHDAVSTGDATYFSAFVLPQAGELGGVPSSTEKYYSVDYGSVHVVVLDSQSSGRGPNDAMAQWLRQDLAANTRPWVVASFHHPPYTKGSHDSDSLSDSSGRMVQMRENLLPILEAGGADLVVAGHSHVYERTPLLHGAYQTPSTDKTKIIDGSDGDPGQQRPYRKSSGSAGRGTVYVTAGHGGIGVTRMSTRHPLHVRSEVALGSCLLTATPTALSVVNIRRDGVVSDRYAVLKGDALLLLSPNGGEALPAGVAAEVSWVSGGTVAPLKLEWSADGGTTWSLVAEGLTDTGAYSWTPPARAGSRNQLRLTSQRASGPSDTSDGLFTLTTGTPSRVSLPMGSQWRYFDGAADPGSSWATSGFNDGAWSVGNGQIGYGDSDEATRLTAPSPARASVYFRRAIDLPAVPTAAHLKLLYDDGAAVFVNGQEVHRKRLASGSAGLAHTAFAASQSVDNEISELDLGIAALAAFVPGRNVIAVVVKQVASTSSDLSFDLALDLTMPSTPPPVNGPPVLTAPTRQAGRVGELLSFTVTATDPDQEAITLNALGVPPGARFDAATGRFDWTPAAPARTSITFEATDGTHTVQAMTQLEVSPAPTDAGVPDVDAGTPLPDAGTATPDAGTVIPDAGTNPSADAGGVEPPSLDAGAADAGSVRDAGVAAPDAGQAATLPSGFGCGCGSGADMGWLALAGLLGLGARRRERRPARR